MTTQTGTAKTSVLRGVGAATEAFKKGGLALVIDTDRPERGGIVVASAERTNDDTINFMATHARGLVSLSLLPDRIERLGLEPQGPITRQVDRENYTASIEARDGVTTGISAADRARTVIVAIDPRARAEDLASPGHTFPAIADYRGVVARPGWAEAALDIARSAATRPVATFCVVLDDAGEIATGAALDQFAAHHELPVVSIAEIVEHRMATESFVTLLTQATVETGYGEFLLRVFKNELDDHQHLALTLGELHSPEPLLVRIHSECLTGDVFGSGRCDCGPQLREALHRIRAEGRGALLYLRQEGRGIGLVKKISAYGLQDHGHDTVEANLALGLPPDKRDYSVGAQMLLALGARHVRLLTNNPKKVEGIQRFGIEVVKREQLEIPPTELTHRYLSTKKAKLGHLLTQV